MASLLDAFRETFSDENSLIKIVTMAIPVFVTVLLSQMGPSYWLYAAILGGIVIFTLFGLLIQVATSVLNEKDYVIPPINPFKFFFTAIKGSVAIAPITIICTFLFFTLSKFLNFSNQYINLAIMIVMGMLFVSLILTSLLMYATREKITDVFNFQRLIGKTDDVLVTMIFFVLIFILLNAVTMGLMWYILYVLFGVGKILFAFSSYALVFNIIMVGHYLAQLQYEVLEYDKDTF